MKQARTNRVIDHTALSKAYPGKWVVLDATRTHVVASGTTLQVALRRAGKQAVSKPTSVLKVPTRLLPFVGATA